MASNHIPQEGRGVLFQNLEKKQENHPDYKGQVMHNGEIIKLAAWKKTHANGHLFSISISKNPNEQQYPKEVTRRTDDSDVPF